MQSLKALMKSVVLGAALIASQAAIAEKVLKLGTTGQLGMPI